jgi:hypothetical protein
MGENQEPEITYAAQSFIAPLEEMTQSWDLNEGSEPPNTGHQSCLDLIF